MILVKNQNKLPQTSLISDLKSISLDNGLTLIHQHIASSAVVVADIWIDVGVISESESLSGMSHFLEHMIFKGTKSILPGDFDYIVESRGGFANAATSYDYTHFFLTTATSHFKETLPYLSEILLQAEIAKDQFEIERDVVLEELRCTTDNHDWIIFQALVNNIYHHHPYRRSVLGEESLLIKHTPEQMRCYHRHHYQPEKMNVVLVGDIQQDEAVALVEKSFNNFATPSLSCPIQIDSEAPMVEIRRQELFLPRLEQPRIVMGWMASGIEDLEGAIALDVLSVILAGGRTSRLTKKLREEDQLVIDIGCDFSLQKHSSLFTITAYSCVNNLEQIEARIRKEIELLRKQPVSDNELKTCQKSLCHDYIFSTETPEQLSALYGYYQILQRADLALQYPHIVKNLSAEKIQLYARRYLSTEYYAVCYAYPHRG